MDKIYIRDLALRTIIGTFPDERREKQEIIFNIVLECDFSKASKSDDIADTVDYKKVKKSIMKLVEKSTRFLVEKLAADVAELCLTFDGVESARVTLDKPGALRFARSVAVEITRP